MLYVDLQKSGSEWSVHIMCRSPNFAFSLQKNPKQRKFYLKMKRTGQRKNEEQDGEKQEKVSLSFSASTETSAL